MCEHMRREEEICILSLWQQENGKLKERERNPTGFLVNAVLFQRDRGEIGTVGRLT